MPPAFRLGVPTAAAVLLAMLLCGTVKVGHQILFRFQHSSPVHAYPMVMRRFPCNSILFPFRLLPGRCILAVNQQNKIFVTR